MTNRLYWVLVIAVLAVFGVIISVKLPQLATHMAVKADLAEASQEAKAEGRAMCAVTSQLPTDARIYVKTSDGRDWKLQGEPDPQKKVERPEPPEKHLRNLPRGGTGYTVTYLDSYSGKLYLNLGRRYTDTQEGMNYLKVMRSKDDCWSVQNVGPAEVGVYMESGRPPAGSVPVEVIS